jgi:hypothetical protein
MTLDKEEHRAILLELIAKAAFPGSAVDQVVELRDAVASADVPPPSVGHEGWDMQTK